MGLIDANKNRLSNTKMGKSRRDSQGTHHGRMDIFTWYLSNGVNKADNNGVETKVLMEHYQRMSGQWDLLGLPNIKGL